MSHMYPTVTVVTLTYRHFERLWQTVDSVLSQDYPNIEYIISDDGSEDFPRDKLIAYINEKNIRQYPVQILQNPENVGTVKNINGAYRAANGEYLFNLSCGDIFFSNSVVRQLVDRFQQTNARVLVASRLLYEGDYKPICLLPHFEERKIIESLNTSFQQYKAFIISKFYDMASGSAMYFTRDILKEYNFFDEKYRLWEDGPFLARYLWEDRLEFAYDIISIWYETGGVSSGGFLSANIALKKDILLFSQTDRVMHRDSLSGFENLMLDYRLIRMKQLSVIKRVLVYIRYFPQAISYFLYGRERTRYRLHDKKYITEILEQSS